MLHDLEGRGLKAPALVISDGNPGLIRSLKEVWPKVSHQRCTAHKTRNVVSRVSRERQREVKQALSKIKACLQKVKARTQEALWKAVGDALTTVTVSDASNWFFSCGYIQP